MVYSQSSFPALREFAPRNRQQRGYRSAMFAASPTRVRPYRFGGSRGAQSTVATLLFE
jgi:hypothetical protein